MMLSTFVVRCPDVFCTGHSTDSHTLKQHVFKCYVSFEATGVPC